MTMPRSASPERYPAVKPPRVVILYLPGRPRVVARPRTVVLATIKTCTRTIDNMARKLLRPWFVRGFDGNRRRTGRRDLSG
jgi:hypothetical protein